MNTLDALLNVVRTDLALPSGGAFHNKEFLLQDKRCRGCVPMMSSNSSSSSRDWLETGLDTQT